MRYKIELNGSYAECDSKTLINYTRAGWKVVDDVSAAPTVSKTFDKLTKTQLKQLCKEKGIDYTDRDTNAVLRAKLQVVSNKTISEKPTNKRFNDSLIKE